MAKASSNKVLIDKFEKEWARLDLRECKDEKEFTKIMAALMFINDK